MKLSEALSLSRATPPQAKLPDGWRTTPTSYIEVARAIRDDWQPVEPERRKPCPVGCGPEYHPRRRSTDREDADRESYKRGFRDAENMVRRGEHHPKDRRSGKERRVTRYCGGNWLHGPYCGRRSGKERRAR